MTVDEFGVPAGRVIGHQRTVVDHVAHRVQVDIEVLRIGAAD